MHIGRCFNKFFCRVRERIIKIDPRIVYYLSRKIDTSKIHPPYKNGGTVRGPEALGGGLVAGFPLAVGPLSPLRFLLSSINLV